SSRGSPPSVAMHTLCARGRCYMTGRTGWGLSLLAAAALLTGCARGHAPKIEENWLARVPPEQMGPVERARAALQQAENEKNRLDVAKSERNAAQSRVKAAENQVELARNTGDANAVEKAEGELAKAEAGLAAAEAQVEWAEANREAAEARVKYAEAEVRTHEALLSQAQYQVLADANDTRVRDMDPQSFEAEVSARRAEAAQARRELQEKEQKVASAYQKWDEARSRAQESDRPAPGEFP